MDYNKLIEYSLSNKNIVFYSGSFSKRPSIFLSELVENTLEEDLTRKIKNRTLFLLIEILQNIEKYSFHHPTLNDDFIMVNDVNELIISASNVVENKNIDHLKAILERVEKSNQEELNKLFTRKLTKSLDNDKISPGLGLIEIRRKNKKLYHYNFNQINEDYTRYEISVSIEKNENIENNFDLISSLRKELFNENPLIGFCGNFENSTISSILNLVNKAEFTENKLLNSKYHHALIELVQNAKEHTPLQNDIRPGFFSIENTEKHITIACCNYVTDSSGISSTINNLNSLDEEGINQLSKDALLDTTKEGGLGMIQFAKYLRPSPIISESFFVERNKEFYYISGNFIK